MDWGEVWKRTWMMSENKEVDIEIQVNLGGVLIAYKPSTAPTIDDDGKITLYLDLSGGHNDQH